MQADNSLFRVVSVTHCNKDLKRFQNYAVPDYEKQTQSLAPRAKM